VAPQILNRPVATRWNSLIPVVRQALLLQVPLERLCLSQRHNNRKGQLRDFLPKEIEWALLIQLCPLLEVRQSTVIGQFFYLSVH
jgi:hypothetical protein